MPVMALLLACTTTSPRAVATLPPTAGPQGEVAEDEASNNAGGQGGGDTPTGDTSPGDSSVPAGGGGASITGQPDPDTLTTSDLEDDNLLDIVSFAGSGNVDLSLTCNYVFASDAQAAANSSLKSVPSGTVLAYTDIDLPYSHIVGGNTLHTTPRICVLDADLLDGAVALSPSGEGYAPYISSTQKQFGTVFGATIPLEALRQPGVWTLQIDTSNGLYQLGVQIPVPTVPVYRRQGQDVWVGGFGGGERVRGYGQTNSGWDLLEFQVNSQGYALFTAQTSYLALYLAGESGATALPALLQAFVPDVGSQPVDRQALAEWLYLELWQGGAPPNMTFVLGSGGPPVVELPTTAVLEVLPPPVLLICNSGLATRLSVGDKSTLVLAGGYPLHFEPGQLADLAIVVPQGASLPVVGGPECVASAWWWKVGWSVNSSVVSGWLPETEGSKYVLEPVD